MKKVWLVILTIVIIALVGTGAWIVISSNNETKKSENIINETGANMSTSVNSVENETKKSENKAKNEVQENKVEKEEEKNDKAKNEVNNKSESAEEKPKTNEEKAIEIVKNDWKNKDGVYFSSMGIDSNERYIITVNDSNTTQTLAWYAVNVSTGEFEIQ